MQLFSVGSVSYTHLDVYKRQAFTHSITGALSSTLNICAFVLFFTVVILSLIHI